MREGVLDGKSHVRGAELGLERAVHEQDGRVDDALRMHDDVDRVVVDIVQPVCLDHLQALVREGRRVDRDLRAHRPRRVAQGLLGRDRGERLRRRVEERAARRGEDQPRDRRPRLADQALPDRRVLRVDRAQPGERRRRAGRTGRPRGALRRPGARPRASRGGRRRRASPCWRSRRPCRRAARRAPGRSDTTPPVPDDHEVDVVAGRERLERVGAADPRVPGGRSSGAAVAGQARRRPAGAAPPGRSARRRCGPLASATTRNRSACCSRTSTAWRPMLPVEPRRATDRGCRGPVSAARARTYSATTGRGEQERVDPVEDAAVARDQRPRVLGAGGALEHRLGEVAGLGGEPEQRPEHDRPERRLAEAREHERDDDRARDRARRRGPRSTSRARCGSGTCGGRSGARRGRRRCRSSTRRAPAAGSSRARRRGPPAARRRRDRRAPSWRRGGRTRAARRRSPRTPSRSRPPARRADPGRSRLPTPARTAPDGDQDEALLARRAGSPPGARARPRSRSRTGRATGSPRARRRRKTSIPASAGDQREDERDRLDARGTGRRAGRGRGRAPRARGSGAPMPAASARTGACGARTRAGPRRTRRARSPATGAR